MIAKKSGVAFATDYLILSFNLAVANAYLVFWLSETRPSARIFVTWAT